MTIIYHVTGEYLFIMAALGNGDYILHNVMVIVVNLFEYLALDLFCNVRYSCKGFSVVCSRVTVTFTQVSHS